MEIKNLEQSKSLIAGTNWIINYLRIVVTGRKNGAHVDEKGLWTLEKISGNVFRIKTKVGGEYLYTDEQGLVDIEGQIRGVFTWTNTTTTPDTEPEYWGMTADWELIKVEKGYLIKSVKYSVYLYAADVPAELAERGEKHIVLTRENVNALSEESVWNFESDFAGN